MRPLLSQRRLLFPGGLLLAALLLGGSAPSARGSCGQYVTIAGRYPAAQENPTEKAPMPAPGHAPCKGPSCSRDPVAPPPVSAVPTAPSPPDWAWADASPTCQQDRGKGFPRDDPSSPPPPPARRIYHPPRV
jgi:hypothetical protein